MSRRNSTISNYENQLEEERRKASDNVESTTQEGNEKLRQAKSNLSDDLAYVQAGASSCFNAYDDLASAFGRYYIKIESLHLD